MKISTAVNEKGKDMYEKMQHLAAYREWCALVVIIMGLVAGTAGLVQGKTGLTRFGMGWSCAGALLFIICIMAR
jgi:hypothetical protein